MQPLPEASAPDAIEAALLLEAIYRRYGYDFRGYAGDPMKRRLAAALVKLGMSHLGELQHRLLTEPAVFETLLDQLVVPVSEMFRDPPFFLAFRERVLPVLKTYPEIKIWHAGCASGEEAYSTAILFLEQGLLDRVQIYATDLSARAIEQAREGVYREVYAEAYADNYTQAGGLANLEDYYVRAYGKIAMKEEVRKHIVFFQHSLASDFSLGKMHVILCRNVLIYFDAVLRARVMDMFGQSLQRGGFLCLGKSESLASDAASFEEFAPEARIYRWVQA